MRIAIAGAGISGSYLAFSLSRDHEVEVYERRRAPEDLGRDCAWGTSLRGLRKYSSVLDRDPSDYLRHVGEESLSDFYVNRDMVTFDKNGFIRDLLDDSEAEVRYGVDVRKSDLGGFDLAIDATGTSRSLLLPSEGDLGENWICPCFQAEVRSRELPADFYIELKGAGYLWVFPQGEEMAKVGCGSFDLDPRREVKNFLSGRDHELLDEVGARVRLIPPSRSRPFYVDGDPPVLGVGEAIGAVSPVSGEGILPSLICSDLLLEGLRKRGSVEDTAEIYESMVIEEFSWADGHFNFYKSVRFGNRMGQLWNLLRLREPEYSSGYISKFGMVLKGL